MRTFAEKSLWDAYARCYDVIAVFQPYQQMIADVVAEVPRQPSPRRVLDAGCGTGNLAQALLTVRPDVGEVVAADRSVAMLRRSRRKNPTATHLQVDLDGELGELSGSFDVIVCTNVLYTLADPHHSLTMLRRRLTPDGRLVVTTPRARVDTKKIVRQHIELRGAASLRRLVLPLIVVALINARIVRTAAYHFLTRDQVCELLGTDAVRLTYSDQVWLAVC
jgi:ubiquinone/menaquinone biosynthesis C-methylase UbiE